jgi:hypothetical protein
MQFSMEKMFPYYSLRTWREMYDLEDLGLNGMLILGCDTVNWVQLAQDRVQWQALVNPLTQSPLI